jgi:NAD(P)-dependent dehydrogenase (short-subunit alcohol dehydrogenase family)
VSLGGKVALVTGAAGGIGRALVEGLEDAGAVVVSVDLRDADLIVDVTDPQAVVAMMSETEVEHGGLDILVNNAGGYDGFGPYEGAPEYATAKAGVMRLTACLRSLAERGIRVNCVCPHTVATPAVLETIGKLEREGGDIPQALRDTPLGPEEVADSVLRFLVDDTLAGRVEVLRGGEAPRLLLR